MAFRWTITKKVGGTVAVLLTFILALLIHSLLALNEIGAELTEIAQYDVPLTEHANEIEIAQLEQRILMDEYVRQQLNSDNTQAVNLADIQQWNNKLDSEFRLALEIANKAKDKVNKPEFSEIYQTLLALKSDHDEIAQHISLLFKQGYQPQRLEKIIALDEAFDKLAIALIHSIEKLTQRKADLALKHEQQFEFINLSLSVVACFIGLFLASVIVISIKASIDKMSRNIRVVTSALQSKDGIPVEQVEKVTSSDELSDLANNLSDMIETVSSEISERDKTAEVLTEKANKDHLTGCFNRLSWDESCKHAIEQSLKTQAPLSLIFFDIDNFKLINDTYGHDIGDQTLIDVAKIIQRTIRQHDSLYRTGGEEFSILLPDTQVQDAQYFAERIRLAIADYQFEQVGKVTISLGVTQFLGGNDSSADFAKRADSALYQAKNDGRNTIKML